MIKDPDAEWHLGLLRPKFIISPRERYKRTRALEKRDLLGERRRSNKDRETQEGIYTLEKGIQVIEEQLGAGEEKHREQLTSIGTLKNIYKKYLRVYMVVPDKFITTICFFNPFLI